MKHLLILFVTFLSLVADAQEATGIKFVKNLSWQQVKAEAKAKNKYIFIDGFTTWCGPCKEMDRSIYPLPEVGNFYNANFINVKVQIDKTATDNEEVRNRYADAAEIAKLYDIKAFPTYVFVSPDGELVHRFTGMMDAKSFIAKGGDALNPEKQYYTMKKQYLAGKNDPKFVVALVHAAQAAYDADFAPKVIKKHLASQTNLMTLENLMLLSESTQSIIDTGFYIFRNYPKKVDSLMGKGASIQLVKNIVTQRILNPLIAPSGVPIEQINWELISKSLNPQYSDISEELILNAKIGNFQHFKNWPKFSEAVSSMVTQLGDKTDLYNLNNYAWKIFEKCEDQKCVKAALDWSKRTLAGGNSKLVMFLDTYACLLYKSGDKTEAIKVEEEALKIAGPSDKYLVDMLAKMKNGENIWSVYADH